jgi:hypothetical protein
VRDRTLRALSVEVRISGPAPCAVPHENYRCMCRSHSRLLTTEATWAWLTATPFRRLRLAVPLSTPPACSRLLRAAGRPSCVVCPVLLYLHAPILLQWRAECLLRHSYWLFRDRLMPIDRKQQVGSFSGPFQCSVTPLPPPGAVSSVAACGSASGPPLPLSRPLH